jgi:hypothetical protein
MAFFFIAGLDDLPDIVQIPFIILVFLSPILYLLSRVSLLVLAFVALRSLPHSAANRAMDCFYTTRLGYVFVLCCYFVTIYLTRITLLASANPEHVKTRPTT